MRRVRGASPDAKFEYDLDDPPGFRNGMARFGGDLGATDSGATLYELGPAKRCARITTSTARRSGRS